jgi:hypothetical protein
MLDFQRGRGLLDTPGHERSGLPSSPAGICQAGWPMDGLGVQARGRCPASLPAAMGGHVSVYQSGSCERPWNCLVGRHPGDTDYAHYYTNIRIAA